MNAIIPLELTIPPIRFTEEALENRALAVVQASAVESVHNADSQSVAVAAQTSLRKLISEVEKSRKAIKEPVLEAGRAIDKAATDFVEQLKSHELRLARLCGDYQQAELEKAREAERKAQAERERIAREQAEAIAAAERAAAEERARIAREQAEATAAAERKAAEERAKAEAVAAAERAAAKSAEERVAAEERARIAREQAEATAAAERKAAEERAKAAEQEAADKLEAEKSRQAELSMQQTESITATALPTRAAGQSIRQEWEIKRINEFALMRARPDLVRKVEFDIRTIKEELARGAKLPGVEAELVTKSGVRLGREKQAIEV